jgi:hypothetical protein
VQERLLSVGTESIPMTTAEFGRYLRDDVRSIAVPIQKIGIEPTIMIWLAQWPAIPARNPRAAWRCTHSR